MDYSSLDLTFFAWSDAHLGYNQDFGLSDIRGSAIDQMNGLCGWPFPKKVGGFVGTPEFVVHCGDIVDGDKEPRGDIKLSYFRYFMGLLKIPHYEVLGNHEINGNNPQFMDYFIQKYGARSYSFNKKGVLFIAIAGEYDEKEQAHIPVTELAFLENTLHKAGGRLPVVLFQHSPLDSIKNMDSVLGVLKGSNIILSMAGHKHRPSVSRVEGIPCVSVGHCRNHPIDPSCGRSFYITHIRGKNITAVAWRWDMLDWEKGQGWFNSGDIEKNLILKAEWHC